MSYQDTWRRLAQIYGEGEAKAIARMVYEVRYGLTLSDLLMGRDADVPSGELEQTVRRLEHQEPVQYVLGQCDFCGRTFLVDGNVLIPRPETAELCRWISEATLPDASRAPVDILDIGTGSGCIAITLAAMLPRSRVSAWDISSGALEVARENARRNGVPVDFSLTDALAPPADRDRWHLIVSNPPYICRKESSAMSSNVLDHEPHTALFVPDDDPLLFYRAIARYGLRALKSGGWLYFEINPLYASPLMEMLRALSYTHVEPRADEYGKQRMIKAQK